MEKLAKKQKKYHTYWYSKKIFVFLLLIFAFGFVLIWVLMFLGLITSFLFELILLLCCLPILAFFWFVRMSSIFVKTPEQKEDENRKKAIKEWKKKNKDW